MLIDIKNNIIFPNICSFEIFILLCDAHHYTAPRPDGTVTARCISEALQQANYQPGENLYINAHGTGTSMNDAAETQAIKLALGEEDAMRASISSS